MAKLRSGQSMGEDGFDQSHFGGSGSGGGGGGGPTVFYWVLEEDGTSKWQKEEGDGFWILEENT